MTLTSASASAAISARAVPDSQSLPVAGKRLTATATIGGSSSISYPLADITYALTITAAASGNVATLDLLAGTCTGTTGSPVIVGGGGVDFSGAALPTAGTLYAVRLVAGAANTQAVVLDLVINEAIQNVVIPPGAVIPFLYASVGEPLATADEIAATFNAISDTLTLELIAQSAPA